MELIRFRVQGLHYEEQAFGNPFKALTGAQGGCTGCAFVATPYECADARRISQTRLGKLQTCVTRRTIYIQTGLAEPQDTTP